MNFDMDAKNPLCERAMTLGQAKAGVDFLTFDAYDAFLSYVALKSGHEVVTECSYPRVDLDTRVVAVGVEVPRLHPVRMLQRKLVHLDTRGVCPYADGTWEPNAVSVLANRDGILALDECVKKNYGYCIRDILWSSPALWSSAFSLNGNVPKEHRQRLADLIRPFIDWV